MKKLNEQIFNCPYRRDGNKQITIEDCEECKKSHNCDMYATILDDSKED